MFLICALFLPIAANFSANPAEENVQVQSQKLILYSRSTCPFCKYVLGIAKEENISLEIRDIANPIYETELRSIGGKKQVPCLLIEGKPLYESTAIAKYFTSRKSDQCS